MVEPKKKTSYLSLTWTYLRFFLLMKYEHKLLYLDNFMVIKVEHKDYKLELRNAHRLYNVFVF